MWNPICPQNNYLHSAKKLKNSSTLQAFLKTIHSSSSIVINETTNQGNRPSTGLFLKNSPPEAFVVVSFCCRALSPLSKLLFLTETTNALPCQRLGPELDLSKFSKLNYHFLNYNDSFSNFKGWILLPPSEISRVTIGSDFPQFRCPSLQKCGCSSLIITT